MHPHPFLCTSLNSYEPFGLTKRCKNVVNVIGGYLYVIAADVVLIVAAGDVLNSCICCGVRLRNVIVEYSTGLLASLNVVTSLLKSINTYKVNIRTNGLACCLDCLQSAESHRIVVTENNLDVLAVLCKRVCNERLCLRLIPLPT